MGRKSLTKDTARFIIEGRLEKLFEEEEGDVVLEYVLSVKMLLN